jgi:hypothetical protein
MKLISKFSLALSLTAMSVAPVAFAKKEEKKKEAEPAAPAGPKLKLSKPFTTAYAPAVDALVKKKDLAAAKAAFPAALAAATSEDDKYEAGIFAVNLGTQTKDIAMQKQGIDLLLQSPLTPPQNKSIYQFQRAAWSYDARDFANATTDLNKAYDMGYRKNDIELLVANSLGQLKRYPEAVTWMRKYIDAAKANGQKIETNSYALAANYAIKSKDDPSANGFLKDLVRTDGKSEYWHDALSIFMRSRDLQLQEMLDVFRLMRRTNSLNYEQEYAGYAESADARRYPAEVSEVINEGIAKGTISKTNRTLNDALQQANSLLAEDKRTLGSSETSAKSAAGGYQAALSGDALFSHKEYARAKAMYELALSKGSVRDKEGVDQTDRVNMRLAQSKIGLGDLTGAKADLAKITGVNRKAIAEYWMIFVDQKTAPKPAA